MVCQDVAHSAITSQRMLQVRYVSANHTNMDGSTYIPPKIYRELGEQLNLMGWAGSAYVDEDALDGLLGEQELERLLDSLSSGSWDCASCQRKHSPGACENRNAPPPTSRKLAGLPPLRLRTSMVAMASPAPLTRHPIEPSSLMKLRPNLAASTSEGSSWVKSRRLKTACGWEPRKH